MTLEHCSPNHIASIQLNIHPDKHVRMANCVLKILSIRYITSGWMRLPLLVFGDALSYIHHIAPCLLLSRSPTDRPQRAVRGSRQTATTTLLLLLPLLLRLQAVPQRPWSPSPRLLPCQYDAEDMHHHSLVTHELSSGSNAIIDSVLIHRPLPDGYL